MPKTFSPVSIGTRGRRAIAWFVKNGLVVSATDADVAAHAMAVVMDALQKIGQPLDERHQRWARDLVTRFPAFPDPAHFTREHSAGKVDVNINTDGIGYGYIKPSAAVHECGGAVFDHDAHVAMEFEPRTVTVAAPPRILDSRFLILIPDHLIQ
jgi:hypothetical protein